MKKLITALLVVGSLTVTQAEARCCWRGGYWVAPALIGGVVGYEIAKHQNHVIECKDFPFVATSNGVEEIVHVKQCRVDNGPWQTPVEK